MKKIFLFAALACIVLASCQKEGPVASVQNDGQQEITFSALSKAMTKGVLGGGESFEGGLGESSNLTHRAIIVAGTMAKDGGVVDFLPPTTFKRFGTSSKWEAAKWDPSASDGPAYVKEAVYYPIGGDPSDYHFLAYSERQDNEDPNTTLSTSRWYSDSEVEIYVDDKSQYNEIVYSGFVGNKSGEAQATFSHSQAIVSVHIKAKNTAASGEDPETQTDLIINKIGFKDVKTSGTLLLKYDVNAASSTANKATAQWLFNAGCTCKFADMGDKKLADITNNKEVDFTAQNTSDTQDILGKKLTTTGFQLDRLFPAQELQATVMVVNYTLAGNTYEIELKLDKDNGTPEDDGEIAKPLEAWKAGKQYKYNITVNLNEITINPNTVDAWTSTSEEETYGQYDPANPTT